MTAVAAPPQIVRFKASRPQPCAAAEQLGWQCNGVQSGERAGYVGKGYGVEPSANGVPPVCCAACCDSLAVGAEGAHTVNEQSVEESTQSWDMTDPASLVMPPLEQGDSADLAAWDGPLCDCPNRAYGFARDPESGRWVHTGCRRPALRYADGRPEGAQPIDSPRVTEVVEDTAESDADRAADAAHQEWIEDQAALGDDARSALAALRTSLDEDTYDPKTKNGRGEFRALVEQVLEHLDDDTVARISSTVVEIDLAGVGRVEVENRLSDALIAKKRGAPTPVDAPKECDCSRVTKRAAIHLDAAGRPIHEHCGGVLREKHRHLAPVPETAENDNTATEEAPDDEPADEHPHADSAFHGEPAVDAADPDAGQPAGPAAGPVRPGEDGEGPGGEGAQGADGGDQARGADSGAGLDGHRGPQPVPDDAAAPDRGALDAPGPEADAGRAPAAFQPAGEAVVQLEAGAPAVVGATGGLAAFFAQPSDDEGPAGTLAEFFAQPMDDDSYVSENSSRWACLSVEVVADALYPNGERSWARLQMAQQVQQRLVNSLIRVAP